MKTVPILRKDLACESCGGPRYENSPLCPDCWGEENDGGTRNRHGTVVQAKLDKDVWQATNFAASMMREGTYRPKAIRIAASYYHVEYEDVQRALSQRSGRTQKGRTR